ncbi:Rho Gtpase-Activating Protein 40 [Manis pentadactyla]|nr:Rho Gtpase-Activating Protein 40 [Manis pentadactyla]
MTQIYALIGSPGAKAQPSLAGRGHSTAKSGRSPAGEPVLPGRETESQWLQDTGLSGLSGDLGLDGEQRGLLCTHTQTQVTPVCHWLDIYAWSI